MTALDGPAFDLKSQSVERGALSLSTARCRASRHLGTVDVWKLRNGEPRDALGHSQPFVASTTSPTLSRSVARSRSLWKQKQRMRTKSPEDDSDSRNPKQSNKRRKNTPLVDPFTNDDLQSIKRLDTASTAELWNIDIRLTLLWCLSFEARLKQHQPALDLWLAIIDGTRERVDWGMWETGDEQWLRTILLESEDPTTDRFRLAGSLLSPSDWALAKAALKRRAAADTRTAPGPFSSWSTRQRVLRIAWCTVTDGSHLIGTEYSALVRYIDAWAHFTCPFRLSNDLDARLRLHNAPNCFLASCKVGVWQWFKAAVLDYDDGHVEEVIGCCGRCVARALPNVDATPTASPIDRPPIWPVVLWVVFQVQASGRSNTIGDFLALIDTASDPATSEMWAWDLKDERYLRNGLVPFSSTSWMDMYPPSWRSYLGLLDPQGWAAIESATYRVSRQRPSPSTIDSESDATIRIGALVLWASTAFLTSSKSTYSTNTLDTPALLDLSRFLSADPLLNHVTFLQFLISNPRRPKPRRATMKSIQYDLDLSTETVNWHIPHEWLVDNREQLRSMLVQDVVDIVSFVGLVENVYWAWRIPPALPLRFTTSVFAKLLKQQQSDSDDGRLDHLRASFHSWKNWNALTSLINFRTVLSTAIALANYIKGDSLPTSLINVLIHTDILCVCAQMTDILKDPVSYEDFLNTSGEDAQKLLDLIQDLLDYPLLHERVRPVILKALLKLSSKSKLHPRCFTLSDRLQLGEHPIAAGSFADVWKGTIRNETVSVKIMRVYLDNDVETLLREISQEGLIWRQLAHPNLLPFFGAYYLQGAHGRLCLVSPWMENGDISRYLKTNLSADKLSLTLDVALGLEHLHSLKLVHGDLKAVNILVTRSGRAVLADFGLSSITDSKITTSGSIAKAGGTVRWQAPELFRGNSNSFASDVYAFACVCYEIFTGNIPFYDLPNDVAVMFHVVQGGRPKHPDPHPRTGPSTRTGLPVSLWRLMQQCWSENPKDRPTATEIVFRLRDSPIGAVRTDPSADPDWDPWSTSKFRSSLEEHTLFLSCGAMEDWVQFIRRPPTRSHTTEAFLSARKASLSACDVPVHV